MNGTGEEPVWLPRDACTEQTGRESPGMFSYLLHSPNANKVI